MAEFHEEINNKPKVKIRRSIIRRLSKDSRREGTLNGTQDETKQQIQKAIELVRAERRHTVNIGHNVIEEVDEYSDSSSSSSSSEKPKSDSEKKSSVSSDSSGSSFNIFGENSKQSQRQNNMSIKIGELSSNSFKSKVSNKLHKSMTSSDS